MSSPDKDEKSIAKAIELSKRFEDSDNPYFLDTLGWALLRGGKKEESVPILKKSVETMPDNSLFQYHLGLAYYQIADLASAKTHFSIALKSKDEFVGRKNAKKMLKKAEFFGR